MKKTFVILTIALAVMAAPVFAQVTVSGELDYSAMMNGDEVAGEFDKVELDVTAQIDEYNVFKMELEDKVKMNDIGNSEAVINYAKVTTDWGSMFDLAFGVETTMGYTDFYGGDNNYITGFEFEQTWGLYTDKEGGAKVQLSLADGMVKPYVAYMFDNYDKATYVTDAYGNVVVDEENDEQEVLMGAIIDYAPVWMDVYYLTAKEGAVDGIFGYEVYGNVELGDGMGLELVHTLNYNLADDLADGDEMQFGAGVAFNYDAFKVGASFYGDDNEALQDMGVEVVYTMNDLVKLHVAPAFYLADTKDASGDDIEAFQSLTLMATITPSSAVTYTVGYVVADEMGTPSGRNRYVPGAETVLADGGAFVGCAVNF